MRTIYKITRWRSLFDEKAASFEIAYKRGKAERLLWAAIYEMLDANGLRGRPVAHRLRNQFDACDISPPPLGYHRLERFDLSADHLGACVTFEAERV